MHFGQSGLTLTTGLGGRLAAAPVPPALPAPPAAPEPAPAPLPVPDPIPRPLTPPQPPVPLPAPPTPLWAPREPPEHLPDSDSEDELNCFQEVHFAGLAAGADPRTFKQAMACPDAEKWIEAANEEILTLLANVT